MRTISDPDGHSPARPMRWSHHWLGIAAAIVLATAVLAACGRAAADPDDPFPESHVPAPLKGVSINDRDVEMEVYTGREDTGGSTVSLSAILETGKPVLLNFWAGQCPPCRAEMPALQAAYDEFGDSVQFMGVDVGPYVGLGSHEDAVELLQALGITYPTGRTLRATVVTDWRLAYMPATFFLDSDGEIRDFWIGGISESQLRQKLVELLLASG